MQPQPEPQSTAPVPPAEPPSDEPPVVDLNMPIIRRKLDTREQTDPRADYPEDVQRLLRASEMIIVGAHHKLATGKPLSETETAMMRLLGVLPNNPA